MNIEGWSFNYTDMQDWLTSRAKRVHDVRNSAWSFKPETCFLRMILLLSPCLDKMIYLTSLGPSNLQNVVAKPYNFYCLTNYPKSSSIKQQLFYYAHDIWGFHEESQRLGLEQQWMKDRLSRQLLHPHGWWPGPAHSMVASGRLNFLQGTAHPKTWKSCSGRKNLHGTLWPNFKSQRMSFPLCSADWSSYKFAQIQGRRIRRCPLRWAAEAHEGWKLLWWLSWNTQHDTSLPPLLALKIWL